jgi:hypothetical protein
MHLAVKVCQATNGPAFSIALQDSFNTARIKAPDLWIEPGLRMTSNPAKLYEFLVKFGIDTNIFPAPQIVRFSKSK